jgi:hypothetical protein
MSTAIADPFEAMIREAGEDHLINLFSVSPYDTEDQEIYESTEIDDAVVLRHLGISKMNGRPLFDGFYALNLSKNSG